MIHRVYKQKIDGFFGKRWLENQAEQFLMRRRKLSEKNPYNPEIQTLEKKTHPIIRDILSHFKIEDKAVNLDRLVNNCKAELEINLLGRDLNLLWDELRVNENIYKEYVRELMVANSYDQRRFELFVAANFKLQGFQINFIERKSKEERQTPEFTASRGKFSLDVECKQRFQRKPDFEREKFLYLLTANLFPRLINLNRRYLVIEVFWNGQVQFRKVKQLSDFIVGKVLGLTSRSEYNFEEYKLILRPYGSYLKLPKMLQNLQKTDPHYPTTSDVYLAVHKGIFLLINRDITSTTIKRMRELVSAAKNQLAGSLKSKAVYLDVGTLPSESIQKFGQEIRKNPPKNLALLITLKHQLHIGENREILFTPFTEIMWNRKLLPDTLFVKTIPGFIGESGFDSYIQDFLS